MGQRGTQIDADECLPVYICANPRPARLFLILAYDTAMTMRDALVHRSHLVGQEQAKHS